MISEQCIPLVEEVTKEAGYDNYELQVWYDVEDGQTVLWKTSNGKTGIFADSEGVKEKMTLDEVYEYYNNFGRNEEIESAE